MNPLVTDTGSPPIPEVQAWGRAYQGARGPLIDLCQAVPGHPPHPDLLRRLGEAAADPACAKYGFIPGDGALREAYAAESGTSADRVVITAGCNQAFFTAMLTLVPRGAAVLLPTPWYYNHKMTCDMLGLNARPLPTVESGFIPDPTRAAALMDGVAAVVLVTPNNPTGAIYPRAVIESFAQLCRAHGAALVIDETYRDVLPPGESYCAPVNAVRLYSFSKAYAVPGHRIGALTLPDPALVAQATKVLDCMTICPQRPAQQALTWAIAGLRTWREANREEVAARAAAIRRSFAAIPAWRIDSLGAYFAYVCHPFPGVSAWAVSERLAREHGVMLLPAPAFAGSADHLRVSFANVDVTGIERLGARLAAIPLHALAA